MKLARKYASKNHPGRYEIIAMKNSFHGRTFGALTATGQDKYKKGLDPLVPGIMQADFNDFGSLLNLASEKTCAVLLEPVQGEGGIRPADEEYLKKVRQFCDEHDIMLIFDEVQCGVGRTGHFFAYEHYNICPDAVAMAKGLAGGVPIGAVLAKEKFSSAFGPGDHASTFGGNPLATAAANVVVDELFHGGVLENVQRVSAYLLKKLEALKDKFPTIIDVRGVGLLMGAEFKEPVAAIVDKCLENGLLIINAGANILRFVPPLIVNETEIDEGFEILEESLI
ncbi:MAG: aminotransferase class III-fold pyridoxal phosphate-dependent enzyme, partial [Oscillospiraceae bacterium]|nr:aminotransferase class III-fold pyridoxal phosphate-dependent enzyme [Oscillospiraceae bacterium]